MQKITPFLWLDGQIEEAAAHYAQIFSDCKIMSLSPMDARLEINGQKIILFNGGPMYRLNPSFSLFVDCEDQAEVDYYWEKLLQGGAESQCGWLVDKFGISWQVIPKRLGRLFTDPDRDAANRAMQAMFKMTKIDEMELQRAFDGS